MSDRLPTEPKQSTLPPHANARGARLVPLDQGVVSRAAGFVRRMVGLGATAERIRQAEIARREPTISGPGDQSAELVQRPVSPSEVQRPPANAATLSQGYFGPGQPMQTIAPHEQVAGRRFDFPAGYNLSVTPRRFEGYSFDTLRGLASYDLIRLAVETRKDQLARVKWTILPKKPQGQRYKMKADGNCAKIEEWLARPDGVNAWPEWVRIIAEDALVLDGVALFRRRRRDGGPWGLESVDAGTISLLIDGTGRRPLPPNPAYQQIIKGLPATEYTADELTYSIRNPRSNRVYGLSPVEQAVTYINIGIRRMSGQLAHYTEGNIPEAIMATPEGWSTSQIAEFQQYWDGVMEAPGQRRRAKFVPSGVNFWPTHGEGGTQLIDQFDEWLARIIAYAFSLPPTPFVKQMNRATAESAYDTALEEGLEPMLEWLKNLVDREIEQFFGLAGYELVWDDIRKLDPVEKHGMDHTDIRAGVQSLDEVRTSRGEEPLGIGHVVWGIGPLGFMSVEAIKRCIAQGLDMPQQQVPMDGMGLPPGADPLASADPGVLQQLGIGGQPQVGAENEPAGLLPAPGEGTPVGGPEEGGEVGVQGSGETGNLRSASPPAMSRPVSLRALRGDPRVRSSIVAFERRMRAGR